MSSIRLNSQSKNPFGYISNNIHIAGLRSFGRPYYMARHLLHNVAHIYPSEFTKNLNSAENPIQVNIPSHYTDYESDLDSQRQRHNIISSGTKLYDLVHNLAAQHLLKNYPVHDQGRFSDYLMEYPNRVKDIHSTLESIPDELKLHDFTRAWLGNTYNNFMHSLTDQQYNELHLPENQKTIQYRDFVNPRSFTKFGRNNLPNDPVMKTYIHRVLDMLDEFNHNTKSSEDHEHRIGNAPETEFTPGTTVW